MKIKRWPSFLLAAVLVLGLMLPLGPPASASGVLTGEGGLGEIGLSGSVIGPKDMISVTFRVRMEGGFDLPGVEVDLPSEGKFTTNRRGEVEVGGLISGQSYNYTLKKSGFWSASSSFTAEAGAVIENTLFIVSTGAGIPGGGNGGNWVTPSVPVTPIPTEEPPTALEPEPPVQPSEEPAPSRRPGGGQGRPEEPVQEPPGTVPPIIIAPGPGEDMTLVQIPGRDIERSAESGAEIHITFRNGDEERTVVVQPFTGHDRELSEGNQFWVEYDPAGEKALILHIIAQEGSALAAIPHNIIETARRERAAIQVSFEGGKDGDYVLDVIFPVGSFDQAQYDGQDTALELDPDTKSGWIIFTNQYEEHRKDRAMTVPAAAYEEAGKKGLGIKARVYNPDDGEDLWYEWIFHPEDLKTVSKADTDLFITPEPPEDDPILGQVDDSVRTQFFVTAHHGPLPAKAELRVKNMGAFQPEDKITLRYSNPETGQLETVHTDLALGKDGFVTFYLDHCSSYVLTVDTGGFWGWVIFAAVLLALAGLLLLLYRRRRNHTEQLILEALEPGEKTAASLAQAVNARRKEERPWSEDYLRAAAKRLMSAGYIDTHDLPLQYRLTETGRASLASRREKEN